MRRAASLLVLLAAAAAQSPYSADQRQDFERTRQELLARDPLAAKLRDEHLHSKLLKRRRTGATPRSSAMS